MSPRGDAGGLARGEAARLDRAERLWLAQSAARLRAARVAAPRRSADDLTRPARARGGAR